MSSASLNLPSPKKGLPADLKVSRRPRRFFSEQPLQALDQRILIPSGEARHFQKTLRLKPGAKVLLSDQAGCEACALIERYEDQGAAWVRIVEIKPAGRVSQVSIRLFAAFAAKGIMDGLVEKCQELGVEEFRPVLTERTVISLTHEKEGKVLERWYKITREAAKQSGQTRLMAIAKPEDLSAALDQVKPGEEAVFFHPEASPTGWGLWLEGCKDKRNRPDFRLNLFIGPEGGFSNAEIQKARQKMQVKNISFSQVHLGPAILRVETAAVAAVAVAKLLFL